MQKMKVKLLLMVVLIFVFGCFSPFCLLLLGQNAFEPTPELLPIHNEISIVAIGDVMLDSWVIEPIGRNGLMYPFSGTVNHLESADIAIANLEAPFTLVGETFEKTFNFK